MSHNIVKNLLSVGKDAKTVKGEVKGVLTGVLYLAPFNISGHQVCPKASEGCKLACLYTAGRGVYTNTQNGRINKTKWFFEDRESFMAAIVGNVESLIRKAKREGLLPAVRLNGTSDIAWEKIAVVRNGVRYASIMEAFEDVCFYDYTKILGRTKAINLPNYDLTFSVSESNDKDALKALAQGYNIAVVMRVGRKETKPATWSGFPVIDGDETDLRFMDKKRGHVVALFPKGKARYDKLGFVRDVNSTLKAA
jgi:hypothetical protein